jgi:hypothetical protein
MRSLLIAGVAGTATLLLSGCPDISGGRLPGGKSEVTRAHDVGGSRHKVSEIAWFQGTLDEGFSRRGCSETHSRRTLFRF